MKKKVDREAVYGMFGGRCAYCGNPLDKSRFHIDHVKPLYRDRREKPERAGRDELANMVPACPRCNRWKSGSTLEEFRHQIEKLPNGLSRDSAQFRMAVDYGLVEHKNTSVKFWFETYRG